MTFPWDANADTLAALCHRLVERPAPVVMPFRRATVAAEPFWAACAEAQRAIVERFGARWAVTAPWGETVLVELPARLRSYVGPLGGRVSYRRDWRMPAARYWPGGVLPAGVILHRDPPRETRRGRAWRMPPTIDAEWGKAHGLVFYEGAWIEPLFVEIAELKAEAARAAMPLAEAAD